MNEPLRTALDALRSNPLRTALSTLGIVIGVAGLVAVLSLGAGMEHAARAELQRTTDIHDIVVAPRATIHVADGPDVLNPSALAFSEQDAQSLARRVGPLAGVMIVRSGLTTIRRAGQPDLRAKLVATVPGAAPLLGGTMTTGYFLSGSSAHSSGGPTSRPVVLSDDLALRLAPTGAPSSLVGTRIQLRDSLFTVTGILHVDGSGAMAVVTLHAAEIALLPATTPQLARLLAVARRIEDVPAIADSARAWLASTHPGWRGNADVATMAGRVSQLSKGFLIFQLCMGAIAGISLVVGGIGIMNVLLAAVAERTREIGIRKAVGARNRDVRAQFLTESLSIAVTGSAVGVALGLAAASAAAAIIRGVTNTTRLAPGVSWSTIVVPVVAAALTGLVFGMYPAWRAGALSPIDAIRHE